MKPVSRIEYINGDKQRGILYDWKLIRKNFKKLNIPDNVYNPVYLPFERNKYFSINSERSIGKTTQFLLLGLLMYRMYGTKLHYIRQTEQDIAPKYSAELFKTVCDYDYIENIFDGDYNSIVYKSKNWYLCKLNENGDTIDIDENSCCFMIDIFPNSSKIKSSYNAPKGDLILYDEYINYAYYPDEFVKFCDLVKTIIRDRESPIVIMSSNTINPESQYFSELMVYDEMQQLQKGESKEIITPLGTNLYIEWASNEKIAKRKEKVNKLFFGFKNPKLASITGGGWSISNYPHIPDIIKESKIACNNFYIYHNSKYVKVTAYLNDEKGLLWCFTKSNNTTYKDSVILSIENTLDNRFFYGLGKFSSISKFTDLWLKAKQENKWYYQDNSIGCFVDNYLSVCNKL